MNKITPPRKKKTSDYILTGVGTEIAPALTEKLMTFFGQKKITVQQTKMRGGPEMAGMEIAFSSEAPLDPRALTKTLSSQSKPFHVDLAVFEARDVRREKRLVVMDLDSTLIQAEVIDEMAKEAGVGDQVVAITHRAMNGEIPFSEALRERVRLLKGLPIQTLDQIYERVMFTPGAFTLIATLRNIGCKTAVLTGGFDYFTARVKAALQLDYAYSNRLEIKNGRVTGEVLGEIVDGAKKAALMEEIAKREGVRRHQVVAIGDGANDLPMITRAGVGIAFNAKPVVQQAAPYNITQKSLIAILYLLGISGQPVSDRVPPVTTGGQADASLS